MLCKLIEPGGKECIQPLEIWGAPPAAPEPSPGQPPPAETLDWQARLAAAERQWEARARESHQAGYKEGFAAGKQQYAAAAQAVTEKLAAALNEVAALRARLRLSAEADLVKLAIAIARRVLRREITLDANAVAAIAAHALSRVNARDVTRVRCHPEQAAAIGQALAGRQAATLTLEPDAALAPGSVVVETGHGAVDASVDTQLDEIERGLADHLGAS